MFDQFPVNQYTCLDIFDMLSPHFDQSCSRARFRRWFEKYGLERIDVHYGYNGVKGRGVEGARGGGKGGG